jgi:elongation factor 3
MISHNEEFVGALCPEQWHVNDGRLVHKGHLAVSAERFDADSSRPSSGFATPIPGFGSPALAASSPGIASSNVSSVAGSPAGSAPGSAMNSGDEGAGGEMKFRAKKKKKMTRAQLKEREVRRKLRHIEWLNTPKGTPKPPDTDDEA